MATIFMFSGQGSQYYHMGSDLYKEDSVFKKNFADADDVIRNLIGTSIADIIFSPQKKYSDFLDDPVYSSLSLLLVELALVKTLKEKGIFPEIFLGSSFGTLVSSIASDCINETEAVNYVVEHGNLFNEACEKGCMLGVLAPTSTFLSNPHLQALSELAGTNFDNSYVLSLPLENLIGVQNILEKENIFFQKIPVSRAYHSRWIDPAKTRFLKLYSTLGSRQSSTPIYCTSRRLPLAEIDAETFWRTIRGPMQFQDTIGHLEQSGPHHYIDVGPSGTLATFVKYVLPFNSKSTGYPILSPFKQGMKNLENVLPAI